MDTSLSQAITSAFLEAYRRCMDDTATRKPEYFMAFPALVCAAFSAEVGLKTILKREGSVAHGHDLLSLFMRVSDERKIEILDQTGASMEEFASQLKHSRKAFVEWRYIYEEVDEKHINVGFLGKFATAVEKVGLRMKSAA
jgi:hypothetical protein